MAVLSRERLDANFELERRRAAQARAIRGAIRNFFIYIILAVGAIIFIAPFAWMFVASLQRIGDMFRWPPSWIPINPTLDNYVRFFEEANVGRYFANSAYVALAVTFLQMFFNSLAAYTYAKRRFPGRDFLFTLGLATMMIPGYVTLIPTYLILQHMPLFGGNDIWGQGGHGWLDSYWVLIAPGSVSMFGIFLLRQYMKSIPTDLVDAAKIDGAGHFRIYLQIILPLTMPALAAMGIFTFQSAWNEFFWPLITVSSPELLTLPVGLALFVVKNRTVWDILMAGSVVATLPILIVFILFQRWFIRGIALSGIKG
ncbi:MAG TPA: carbohydrate ABC transporter permease [Ardenticatenaceae bacterium]|nr:carbohydrate ABC transporter permease [Ardenticatenaceae bacterium]